MIEWISVSDRLPDTNRNVIIAADLYAQLPYISLGHCEGITHWSELNPPMVRIKCCENKIVELENKYINIESRLRALNELVNSMLTRGKW